MNLTSEHFYVYETWICVTVVFVSMFLDNFNLIPFLIEMPLLILNNTLLYNVEIINQFWENSSWAIVSQFLHVMDTRTSWIHYLNYSPLVKCCLPCFVLSFSCYGNRFWWCKIVTFWCFSEQFYLKYGLKKFFWMYLTENQIRYS